MSDALTVTGARLDGAVVGLRAVDGVITEVGPAVDARPGDEVVDGSGLALVPGLVNGHGHAAMTLFRGYAGDLPLMEWLQTKIWPAEARLDDDDVYWGTRLACLEMIRSGTVRFWDMYWRPVAVARAVEDSGLRAAVGMPLIDGLDPEQGKKMCAEAARALDELAGCSDRITPSLTPHGIYTVSEPSLHWVAQEAAARGLPVHIHFLETEDEVTGCVARTGEQPAAYLDRIGLLNPHVVLAHGCYLDDGAFALVAERGATVVTNPVSNLKLAVGRIFPLAKARAAGVAVGLGTDGAASNNGLDLLQDVKFLALVQKHAERDPAACPASDAWAIATGAWAPALGGTKGIAVGEPADFLLVCADAPELEPGHLVDNLVYAASGAVVDTTVVAGRVLMRNRKVEGEQEIRARALERARRLGVAG
ncbi:MAG TPA: amidohydrolase [Acidimicrobiia bacterium]|nr:amidohydrolase [Acidimicrobiia bacterium]